MNTFTLDFLISALDNNLFALIQNIGLVLLTILIPLAIVILEDILQKRKDPSIGFAELDVHIILDYIFRVRYLLIYAGLIYLPLLLWNVLPWYSRLLELLSIIIGTTLLIKTVIDTYRWLKGHLFEYRFSYLEKLKGSSDMTIAWRSVWQSKDMDFRDEKHFFKIFSSKIDELLQ